MKRLVLPFLTVLCLGALAVPAQARGDFAVSISVGEPRLRAPVIIAPVPVYGGRYDDRYDGRHGGRHHEAYRGYREHGRGHDHDHHPHEGRWSRWQDDGRAWRHARWHQWRERERCREEERHSARIYFRAGD